MKFKKSFFLACLCLLVSMISFGQNLGNFESIELVGNSLKVCDGKRLLQLEFLSNKVIKVQNLAKGELAFGFSSAMMANSFIQFPSPVEYNDHFLVNLDQYQVRISKSPISIQVFRKGSFIPVFEEKPGLQVKLDTTILSFVRDSKDSYQGSGARPFSTNLNSRVFNIANTHNGNYYDDRVGVAQNINTPFIVNSNKFAVLMDSDRPSRMSMDLGGFDSTTTNITSYGTGKWAYYLILGSNDEILNEYTNLTGKQSFPPRWVFGVLQSKEGYRGENEIISVQTVYERLGFPLDAIFFDKYWTGSDSTLGNMTFGKIGFPRPKEMLANLNAKGIESVIRIDPNIHAQSLRIPFSQQFGLLASDGNGKPQSINSSEGELYLYDIFKTNTKSYFQDKLDELRALGVSAFWINNTEPRYAAENTYVGNELLTDKRGLYALEWDEALKRSRFHFTTSAYVGSQRYGAIPRSGDVARYWSAFKLQVPIMINASMSGFAYMHSDIGGYATGAGQADKNEELDLRWLQMSVFSPVLRFHGKRGITEPYELKDPFISLVKEALQLRYALHPYIYTLAYQNSISGRPFCMPMDYFESNTYLQARNDQYFFGENLLVAPIMLHGTPVRRVDLPAGVWFNFWTTEKHEGQGPIFQKVELAHIPVYAKAGAIIPLAKTQVTSLRNYKSNKLSLLFFQDQSQKYTSFEMYEDDGVSTPASNKEWLKFEGETTENVVKFSASSLQSSEPSTSSRSIEVVFKNITSIPTEVQVNEQKLPLIFTQSEYENNLGAFYNISKMELFVKFDWNNKDKKEIEVKRDGLGVLLSAESELKPEFAVYPNPTMSHFNLSIVPAISEVYTLTINDITGRTVLYKNIGELARGELKTLPITLNEPAGSYFVNLIGSKSGKLIEKIVLLE